MLAGSMLPMTVELCSDRSGSVLPDRCHSSIVRSKAVRSIVSFSRSASQAQTSVELPELLVGSDDGGLQVDVLHGSCFPG